MYARKVLIFELREIALTGVHDTGRAGHGPGRIDPHLIHRFRLAKLSKDTGWVHVIIIQKWSVSIRSGSLQYFAWPLLDVLW